MPTSRELVSNKPLVGSDLAKIVLQDLAEVLAGDGFFSPFVAYQRCSYEVRVTLHMDNPVAPRTVAIAHSRLASDQQQEERPELASLSPDLPLPTPSDASALESAERHRDLPSPNAARVSFGLPVEVTTRQPDGSTVERQVVYPRDYPGADTPAPIDTDTTEEERRRLNLPPEEAEA